MQNKKQAISLSFYDKPVLSSAVVLGAGIAIVLYMRYQQHKEYQQKKSSQDYEFIELSQSVGPGTFRDSWRLSDQL